MWWFSGYLRAGYLRAGYLCAGYLCGLQEGLCAMRSLWQIRRCVSAGGLSPLVVIGHFVHAAQEAD